MMDRNDGVNVLFSDEKSAFRIIWQFVDFEIWINKTNESLLIYSCLLIRMLKTAVSIYWLPRHTIPLPVKQKFYTQYTFHSSNQNIHGNYYKKIYEFCKYI